MQIVYFPLVWHFGMNAPYFSRFVVQTLGPTIQTSQLLGFPLIFFTKCAAIKFSIILFPPSGLLWVRRKVP